MHPAEAPALPRQLERLGERRARRDRAHRVAAAENVATLTSSAQQVQRKPSSRKSPHATHTKHPTHDFHTTKPTRTCVRMCACVCACVCCSSKRAVLTRRCIRRRAFCRVSVRSGVARGSDRAASARHSGPAPSSLKRARETVTVQTGRKDFSFGAESCVMHSTAASNLWSPMLLREKRRPAIFLV